MLQPPEGRVQFFPTGESPRKMAGANDPSLTETPEYRIVILFVGFIVVTYLFDKLTEWVDEYLKHHKRRGLLHTIHKLEEELLALGLISLLLIALEVRVSGGGRAVAGAAGALLRRRQRMLLPARLPRWPVNSGFGGVSGWDWKASRAALPSPCCAQFRIANQTLRRSWVVD